MRRASFIATVLVAIMSYSEKSFGQANWELGLRISDNVSAEATIPIAAAPRWHPAVYFDRFGLASYFDWMFAISGGPRGLKFYPGVGPEIYFGDDVDFDIAGNFGAEYSFDFPLTVALDWRPSFRATEGFDFQAGNLGVSARFRFGEGVRFRRVN
ncbi:MAG: hypothetical protein AAGA85_15285 [Bacteroidota bacterium]